MTTPPCSRLCVDCTSGTGSSYAAPDRRTGRSAARSWAGGVPLRLRRQRRHVRVVGLVRQGREALERAAGVSRARPALSLSPPTGEKDEASTTTSATTPEPAISRAAASAVPAAGSAGVERRCGACDGRLGGFGGAVFPGHRRAIVAIRSRVRLPSDPISTVRRPNGRHSPSSSVSHSRRACAWLVLAQPHGAARNRARARAPGWRRAGDRRRGGPRRFPGALLRGAPADDVLLPRGCKDADQRPRGAAEGLARADGPPDERDGEGPPGGVRRRHAAPDDACATTQERLRLETGNLVKALRTPHVRGRWGEVQLRNVVEAAGMLPHCDFQEQASVRDTEGSLLRPDLSCGSRGQASRGRCEGATRGVPRRLRKRGRRRAQEHLIDHARQVRDQSASSPQKAYWRQFAPSPDFVIMFVPDETFIRVAQEHDPALSEDGWRSGVILASPSTLFTLLRTVAATWQQETVAESAREVHELGRELYGRIATMAKHLADAGKALDNAVEHYNAAVRIARIAGAGSGASLRAARHRGRHRLAGSSRDRHCRCRHQSSSSPASSSARSTPPSSPSRKRHRARPAPR